MDWFECNLSFFSVNECQTALVRNFVKMSLHYNETNEHITHDISAWMRGLEWDYFDHHNSAQTEISLKDMVMLHRLGIIHYEHTKIQCHLRSEIHSISESPILCQIVPFHAARYRYLSLCDKLNAAIKRLRYKAIHQILNDPIFVRDSSAMKMVFRSLSTCFSFCPLCREESNNPLQTLLTLYIRDQEKCDSVLSILKLFVKSLQSIHIEIQKQSELMSATGTGAETPGVNGSNSRKSVNTITRHCRWCWLIHCYVLFAYGLHSTCTKCEVFQIPSFAIWNK